MNKVEIFSTFKPLFEPKRYKVYYGGRGGSKSWGFAQALVILSAKKKLRILCAREYQGSIRESVHRLLADTIDRLGLTSFFNVGQQVITGKNGSQFIFEGLKSNTTKIKSLEALDVVWIEEAEAVTEDSWDILIPTIRKQGSEIWVSFNPFDELDSTYQQFVAPYYDVLVERACYEDHDVYVRKLGFADNPHFPDELRAEMEKCKTENYNKYLHIWEGEPSTDFEDSIIKPEWIDAAIDAHKKMNWTPSGIRAMGYDVADSGRDAKAYTMRHGSFVQACDAWTTGDLSDGVEKAYNVALENNITDICYDIIGVGAGAKIVFETLAGNRPLTLQPFNGAASPDDPTGVYIDGRANGDVFKNARAQGFWDLARRFEATYLAVTKGEYSDPDNLISLSSTMPMLKMLKSELSRIQRKRGRSENSYIQIESKEDMRARGLKSPNLADALMYCFATKLKTPSYTSKFDDWSVQLNG